MASTAPRPRLPRLTIWQQCARFSNQPVQRLIYSLLVDYARVPGSYINLSDWDTERDNKLNGVYSTLIADPIGVNSLIAELCEQGQCYIWWDETLQKSSSGR